jgi:outer membrane protein assembly factor BamB
MRTSDGRLLWERSFQSTPVDLGRSISNDAASPTADENCVYFTWVCAKGYWASALDRKNGNEVWRRHLGSFKGEHGSGASPIRFAELLIIPNDQTGPSSAIALDCETGETRWIIDRRSVKTAYSTPTVYRRDGAGAELIIASTAHGVSSFDPMTGELKWELPELFGTIRIVGSPVLVDGLIFAQCGAGGGGKRMVAVKPADPSGSIPAKVVYEIKGSLPYVCTPVAHENRLFLWGDSGVVSCIDTRTGNRIWRERVGGNFFSSPVRTGNRIFCVSREGEVVILAARQEFQLLGRVDLGEPSHSTPAVADGVIFFRTFSHLMAIPGQPGKK